MRILTVLCLATLAAAPGLRGQDTIDDSPRAETLRRRIEERFMTRLTEELDLSPRQGEQMRRVLGEWADKRRTLERTDRDLRERLAAMMRPGIAADEKEVSRLVDRLLDARLEYVETFQDEMKDLADVLTPMQRGQYVLMRDRLMRQVREIRDRRLERRRLR